MKKHFVISSALVIWTSAGVFAQEREIKLLASTLAETFAKTPKRTVAVVDFTDLQGNVTELGRFLAEELSVDLASSNRGIEVVDRSHLKAILQEHKLAATGVIDPATALKLGEIAGVQVLVTGTTTPFGESIRSSIKALDLATAKIVAAQTVEIPRTKAMEDLLARGISGDVNRPRVSETSANPPKEMKSGGQTKTIGQLELTFRGCHNRAEGTLCEALVRNMDAREQGYCLYGEAMSRIVDEGGIVYVPNRLGLAEKSVSGMTLLCANLPSDVPVISTLLFSKRSVAEMPPTSFDPRGVNSFQARRAPAAGLPGEGTRLVLVEFRFNLANPVAGSSMDFQFRDVIVEK